SRWVYEEKTCRFSGLQTRAAGRDAAQSCQDEAGRQAALEMADSSIGGRWAKERLRGRLAGKMMSADRRGVPRRLTIAHRSARLAIEQRHLLPRLDLVPDDVNGA